jgi:hypothetical protein
MEQRLAAVERRQAELEKRMEDFAHRLAENTATTQSIKSDTSQLVMAFRASQLGASLIKWLAGVGSAVIIGYAAFKGLGR